LTDSKKHIPVLDSSHILEGTTEYNQLKRYWDAAIELEDMVKLIHDFDWQVPVILSPKARVHKELCTRKLLKLCLTEKNQPSLGRALGMSGSAVSLRLAKIPELDQFRHITSPMRQKVPRLFGYKHCCGCGRFLPFEMFNNTSDKNRSDGKTSQCKMCMNLDCLNFHAANPHKQKEYTQSLQNNPERREQKLKQTRVWKAENNYRAVRDLEYLLRRPDWVDVDKLKQIAKECPEGYHVDHIIPLKGKLVSGLDIPANLQYLSGTENMSKNNKFTPCSYEDIALGFE
jgi:hypothetical protein